MRRTLRIGLTGPVASGKSTVSAMLEELGATVIDADKLAREVVEKGTPGLAAVVEEFGEELLTPGGDLDRPAMARLVFNDEQARKRLESIVHPLVFERIVALEEGAPPGSVVVHDLPLLAESGRADTFDAVLVVDVPREVQVERMLRERGWTEAEADSRIAAQASREDRLAVATHVIENTGTLEELRARVGEVYADLAPCDLARTAGAPGAPPRVPGRHTKWSPGRPVRMTHRGTSYEVVARAASSYDAPGGGRRAAGGGDPRPGARTWTRRARDGRKGSRPSTSPPSRRCASVRVQAARSGSAILRSLVIASRSSWRTRSAEMPWRAPMSASLCCRPSTSP